MVSFNRNHYSPIGLHLSPRAAVMAQLTGRTEQWDVHALAHVELPHDESLATDEQDRQVAASLRAALSHHHFKGTKVVSCLGSQELFVQNIRLPQLPPEEIGNVVRWEAEERLPYPVNDAEIRHLLAGQVHQDADVKQEVILLACHQGVVERHTRMLEMAGLNAAAIDVEPCATMRCLRSTSEEQSGATTGKRVAYLNLGDKATTVIFAEDNQILFLKYINNGSYHLDKAVARHLELTLDEAAQMRSSVTMSPELDADDEIHRTVIEAIRQPLDTIGSEVELCLRYYKVTFRGKPLEKIYITGPDASPWLVDYLTSRLGTHCEIGNPFRALRRWPTTTSLLECPWRWTTAMGLSMKPN